MRTRPLLLLLSLLFLFTNIAPLAAEMRPITKVRVGIPPTEVLKEIIRTPPVPEAKTGKPTPLVTWLTEPDERLSPTMFFKDGSNRVFTITCPGGQLLPSAASVDFGIRELLTPVLLVAVSSDSRFIELYIDGYGGQGQEMRQILDHLHLALDGPADNIRKTKPHGSADLLGAIEKNIDYQVSAALRRYGDRIAEGRLLVAGGVIDLNNAYGHGKNRLVLININGETDPQKMRLMREVATIGQESAKLLGRTRPKAAPTGKDQTKPLPKHETHQ